MKCNLSAVRNELYIIGTLNNISLLKWNDEEYEIT